MHLNGLLYKPLLVEICLYTIYSIYIYISTSEYGTVRYDEQIIIEYYYCDTIIDYYYYDSIIEFYYYVTIIIF